MKFSALGAIYVLARFFDTKVFVHGSEICETLRKGFSLRLTELKESLC